MHLGDVLERFVNHVVDGLKFLGSAPLPDVENQLLGLVQQVLERTFGVVRELHHLTRGGDELAQGVFFLQNPQVCFGVKRGGYHVWQSGQVRNSPHILELFAGAEFVYQCHQIHRFAAFAQPLNGGKNLAVRFAVKHLGP